MIDNYLDYCKAQRKTSVELMMEYHRQSRSELDDWGKGFYAGHAQSRSFEAHHWRRLQKDIEVREAEGYELVWQPTIARHLQDQSEEVERRNVQSKKSRSCEGSRPAL